RGHFSMPSGSTRLLVRTPGTACIPTISDTRARANLLPSPPAAPVESHTPKSRAVGQTSNIPVAFSTRASAKRLPGADSRKGVLPRRLSRRMASAMRCGASSAVTRPRTFPKVDKARAEGALSKWAERLPRAQQELVDDDLIHDPAFWGNLLLNQPPNPTRPV